MDKSLLAHVFYGPRCVVVQLNGIEERLTCDLCRSVEFLHVQLKYSLQQDDG